MWHQFLFMHHHLFLILSNSFCQRFVPNVKRKGQSTLAFNLKFIQNAQKLELLGLQHHMVVSIQLHYEMWSNHCRCRLTENMERTPCNQRWRPRWSQGPTNQSNEEHRLWEHAKPMARYVWWWHWITNKLQQEASIGKNDQLWKASCGESIK